MVADINYSWRRILNSPKAAVIIPAIFYLLFIIGRLAFNNFDISCFIDVGGGLVDTNHVPKSITVRPNYGYDGQFFYRMANSPFSTKDVEHGIHFDYPAYRHQRIVYPLLAWVLSFGQLELVPYTMVLVNYLMICTIAWLATRIVQHEGQPALWGLAFSMYPGFIMSICRNLSEVTACCLLLGTIMLIRQGRLLLSGVVLAIAVLARETTLLLAVGIGMAWLIGIIRGKSSKAVKWYLWVIPLATFIVWQFILWWIWGQTSFYNSGQLNFGFPLYGFTTCFVRSAHLDEIKYIVWFVEYCFLIGLTVGCIVSLRKSTAYLHEKLAWILFLIMILLLTEYVWKSDMAFFRATAEFYILGILILLTGQQWIRKVIVGWAWLIWPVVAVARAKY